MIYWAPVVNDFCLQPFCFNIEVFEIALDFTSESSSYKIELLTGVKIRVTNSKSLIEILLSSYLLASWNTKFHFELLN